MTVLSVSKIPTLPYQASTTDTCKDNINNRYHALEGDTGPSLLLLSYSIEIRWIYDEKSVQLPGAGIMQGWQDAVICAPVVCGQGREFRCRPAVLEI